MILNYSAIWEAERFHFCKTDTHLVLQTMKNEIFISNFIKIKRAIRIIASKAAGSVLQETRTILVLFSVPPCKALDEGLEHLCIQQLYSFGSRLRLEHLWLPPVKMNLQNHTVRIFLLFQAGLTIGGQTRAFFNWRVPAVVESSLTSLLWAYSWVIRILCLNISALIFISPMLWLHH